jgi:hypothetical protein
MKPLHDRLNDRLEHIELRNWQNGHHPSDFMLQEPRHEGDPEVDALVVLARRLRVAPHMQVDKDFAGRLERRMLHRHTELQLQRTNEKRSFFFQFRTLPAFGVALCLCLIMLVLGAGVLALAAHISDPNNQLYALKRWEQHLQVSLTNNAGDQAFLDLQIARDRLNTLSDLTDPAHTVAYSQALADIDQQLQTATAAINGLPTGTQRQQLASKLSGLKSDAIHILRNLLPKLTLSERLATTGELTHLGDNVPLLINGMLILPPHPHGRATISLSGSDLQPGAQLLVDGKPAGVTGLLQNGRLIFVVVNWKGEQHPRSLGLIDPDGTAVQTTAITIETANGNTTSKSNHNGQGNSHQPTTTPDTPQNGQSSCPGLPDAQELASKYQLSADSQGAAVLAICALHRGTFKATTSNGTTVTASRVYGYGEIDQLLTYAQYLASQDATNPGGKLSDTNVSSYLAEALLNCGSTPLATCLQTHIPNYQPGNGTGQGNGHQPTATPTPHH